MANPAKPFETVRVPFHQGLLESQESSKVPVGFLTELVNWVPEPTGGLRVRGAWQKGSEAGLPATRKNRGIGLLSRQTDPSVVQVSAPFVGTNGSLGFTTSISGSSTTPTVTWGVPTTAGNLLLLICTTGYAATSVTGITFTVAGWTSAAASTDITGGSGGKTQVFYIPDAPVQTGTQTFSNSVTYTNITAGSMRVVYWLVEINGIAASPLDVTVTNTAAGSTSAEAISVTSAATTQASTFVLAVDSASTTNVLPALSTATAGWSEQTESAGSGGAGGGLNPVAHSAAIYYGARRSMATQSITVTASAASAIEKDQQITLVTFKGWNNVAQPAPTVASFLAANDDGTNLDIHGVGDVAAGTYAIVDPNIGSSTEGLPVVFVRGLGYTYYTGSTLSNVRRYNGVVAAAVGTSPVGARCLAISHDRLWAAGAAANPARLYFTQLLDGSAWTGTGSGFFDIGTDDGEYIEDITPFNDGLLIGKQNSLWFLSGTDTTNFTRSQLPAGGAAPGRSLLTTPFGAVIAGREQVWLYDGSTVTRLGNAIERTYGVTGPFVTCSYQDGSIYISDTVRVFSFDLGGTVGTWRIEECEDAIATLYNLGGRQFMGPLSTTNGSLINYRDFPDPIRGKDYDPLSETFSAQTGDLWLQGSLNTITPRQLYLQLRQRADGVTGLVVTPRFNGVDGQGCDVGPEIAGTRRQAVEGFAQKGRVASIGFGISQTLGPGEQSCFDIEDAWIEYIQEGRG